MTEEPSSEQSPSKLLTKNVSLTCDEENCAICFDSFANYGDHRLCCLRCGHLFGLNCIKRWLKESDKCPQCNHHAKIKDIRILYARVLRVLDTVERDKALNLAEREKDLRIKTESKLNETRFQLEMARREYDFLLGKITFYQKKLESLASVNCVTDLDNQFYYNLEQCIEVSKDQSARLVCFDKITNILAVSTGMDSSLFPRYGVKKIDAVEFTRGDFIGLHAKPIKDMCFNTQNNHFNADQNNVESLPFPHNETLLLSVSLDRGIHLTSIRGNMTLLKFESAQPAWSCAWNFNNPNQFYTGSCNGMLHLYDIRNLNSHVLAFDYCQSVSKSPIVSMAYVETESQTTPGVDQSNHGILVGQLDKCYYIHHNSNDTFTPVQLNTYANIVDIKCELSTNHIAISHRPSAQFKNSRYQLMTLPNPETLDSALLQSSLNKSDVVNPLNNDDLVNNSVPSCLDCNVINTFQGGTVNTLITKSHLYLSPKSHISASSLSNDGLHLCAGNEEHKQIWVWNAQTGRMAYKLIPLTHPILDITSCDTLHHNAETGEGHTIVATSSQHLHIFRKRKRN